MRIRVSEFKRIVREEVSRVSRGRLHEMVDQDSPEGDIDLFIENWAQMMLGSYSDNDPSMAALGDEAWEEQVMAAASELSDSMGMLLNDVENRLINGEFDRGKGSGI